MHVLISVSCFVVLFSVLFRLQLLSVVRPNHSQLVRIELLCISNRKQDNKTRHRDCSDCMLILKQCGIYTSSGFKKLARRRTKTPKYEGAQFEQLESDWA